MPTNTANLNLFKYGSTDGARTFNIDEALNANWDKIDEAVAKKYTKAPTGIPELDLDSAVKAALGKARTALQSVTKADVGLGNVDNTSDASKPISTAQQAALNLKANIASPTFTGTPKSTTAAVGTNTTQIATTAFVKTAVDNSATTINDSITVVAQDITTHKADEAAHGIGNKATLKTTDKTTIVGAVNELFIDVDNGKTQIANAIVGKNGTASSSDTFTQLASAISLLGGGVKSVQRGYLNEQLSSVLSKNITISAVNPDNTIVLIDNYGDTSNAFSRVFKTIELVNDVTIKIESGEYYAALYDNWQVLEFDKLKSKQSGVVQLNQLETSKDISLKKVDLSKIGVFFSWTTNSSRTSTGSNDSIASHMPRLVVANDSTLTISRQKLYTPVGTITLRWQVVEFE